MTTVADVVAACYAELDADQRQAVRGVDVKIKARPDTVDLARGCVPGQFGCFYGVGRELETPDGGWELPSLEPATGEICIFLENIRPLTADRVRIVVMHELCHALGFPEEEIIAMGFDFCNQVAA